jgi:alpha-L-fucosidase 2
MRGYTTVKLYQLLIICFLYNHIAAAQGDMEVKFNAPAHHFTESLPLGNGRLGAMVFGGTTKERIVLNESSMWSGKVEDPNNWKAHEFLPQIQSLLMQGKNKEAQELLQLNFVAAGDGSGEGRGAGVNYGCYQTLGDLFINWHDTTGITKNYSRVLLLNKALAITTWERNNIKYKEEVFVSAPHQAIIIRLSSSQPNALSFDVELKRKERFVTRSFDHAVEMTGQLNGGYNTRGISYAAYGRIITNNGSNRAISTGVRVADASACIIILDAATDMNWPHISERGKDPLPLVTQNVDLLANISWQKLFDAHLKDFSSYFDRCQLNFRSASGDSINGLSTQERLIRYAAGNSDRDLPSLYFNFGRYLLISSSRPGGLPANLQGIWAEEYQTPWNGDYHLNINLQMNYWPAEKTNLADCHIPLIDFTRQLVGPGQKTAKAYYNTMGWTAHMMSNPWLFTAPGESATWGSSLTGGAWLCEHLWQHYLYHPDKQYLKSIYPVLKGATQFLTGILIRDPKTGWLVTAPSNSPENTYITENGFEGQTTMGPAMDMQIGRELLSNTIAAAALLKTDAEWSDSIEKIREQLAPNQISPTTHGIQEWIRDYKEAEIDHRHISHLYGLYPYDEINSFDSPQLLEAARTSLLRRGDAGTGWSRAWKLNAWARVGDGNHALKLLKELLHPAFSYESNTKVDAGTYPNLFCAHPPFQIDGNFGGTAAITEMLLQTTGSNHVIRLLPALPNAIEWSAGTVKGFCAPGGFNIDFSWNNAALFRAVIHSRSGSYCHVQLPVGKHIYTSKGKKIKVDNKGDHIVGFITKKNMSYIIQ